jgi:hypothetical protein
LTLGLPTLFIMNYLFFAVATSQGDQIGRIFAYWMIAT